ncbi:STAS domain-containing protein [Gluconacetobacter sp. Hr-1-5]|uniref:STAS domain-containing protein n=1 Tax=Gluconacetobacter sp. Hr-1-5 TaxID=3395370 RepID=UPI003B52A76B
MTADVETTPAPSIAPVPLPERLDTATVEVLKGLVEQAEAADSALDASGVAYIGGLCLQVLLASGRPLVAPSEKVREAFALFGVSEFLSEPSTSSSELSA